MKMQMKHGIGDKVFYPDKIWGKTGSRHATWEWCIKDGIIEHIDIKKEGIFYWINRTQYRASKIFANEEGAIHQAMNEIKREIEYYQRLYEYMDSKLISVEDEYPIEHKVDFVDLRDFIKGMEGKND